MTYSSGSSGYQPAQPPVSYGTSGSSGSSGPSFAKSDDHQGKLAQYLRMAVVGLGLASYFVSFGPIFDVNADQGPSTGSESVAVHGVGVGAAALLAALLAAVGLLPKARNYTAIVAVISVFGALMIILRVVTKPANFSPQWALWVILGLVVLQALAAVGALLLDAGVVSPPAPRPKYDRYSQYGQYGGQYGGYYGQPGQTPYGQHSGPQQSSYGPSYGGGGYPQGPSTGGFSAAGQQHGSQQGSHSGQHQGSPQGGQEQGTSTPPTGFPSFSTPQSYGSGQENQGANTGNAGEHAGSGQGQQSHGGQQPESPSSPSGPTPS